MDADDDVFEALAEAPAPAPRRERPAPPQPVPAAAQKALPIEVQPGTLPPVNLLQMGDMRSEVDEAELVRLGEIIRNRCAEFGAEGTVAGSASDRAPLPAGRSRRGGVGTSYPSSMPDGLPIARSRDFANRATSPATRRLEMFGAKLPHESEDVAERPPSETSLSPRRQLRWTVCDMRFLKLALLSFGALVLLLTLLFLFNQEVYRRTIKNARVLVCSLGENPLLVEQAEQDAEIYRRHFPAVTLLRAEKLSDVITALSSGRFHVLHLLNEFDDSGRMVEGQGARADVTPLFEVVRKKNLLFVYLGGNIPDKNSNGVSKGIHAARVGHEFTLVVTSDRGGEFHSFLDRLLHEISSGELLGIAWIKIRPQDAGAPQPEVDPGPRALVFCL